MRTNQGVNEQQTILEAFSDTSVQDEINAANAKLITEFCNKYKEKLAPTDENILWLKTTWEFLSTIELVWLAVLG